VTTITAVVPATNQPVTLDACLEAIRASHCLPDEIVVVADPGDPLGVGAPRNAGARRATCDVIAFVDADVIVHPDAFCHIRSAFDDDAELTGVFGCYDDDPGGPCVSRFRNLLHHHVHFSSAGEAKTFWAGIGAIRRDAFLAAGGFEADFPVEDIEFGMRAVANGARFLLDPRIQGKHMKRWTLAQMLRTDFAGRAIPWVVLLLRRRTTSDALNPGWRHRLSGAGSLLLAGGLAHRRPRLSVWSLLGLVALNRSFYSLLARRGGPVGAVAGIALHVLHHLTAIAAIPAGILVYLQQGTTVRAGAWPRGRH